MTAFREFLTAWLAERDWLAARLSRETGIAQTLISKWLHLDPRRQTRPSPESLGRMAPVLSVPYEDLMRMCGYLPGEPRAKVNALRQAVRDQLDQWMSTVGPDKEEYFWQHLKVQGDSTVDLIRQVDTAVNAPGDAAVNAAVSARKRRGRKDRDSGSGPLKRYQHSPAGHFAEHATTTERRRAA